MNKIRLIVGELFQSPMGNMGFPAYFSYINTAGKITAKSTMDIETVLLAVLEEQEKINQQNEDNFKQIFEILAKMIKQPEVTETTTKFDPPIETFDPDHIWQCPIDKKEFKNEFGLKGHMRSHK